MSIYKMSHGDAIKIIKTSTSCRQDKLNAISFIIENELATDHLRFSKSELWDIVRFLYKEFKESDLREKPNEIIGTVYKQVSEEEKDKILSAIGTMLDDVVYSMGFRDGYITATKVEGIIETSQ